jgi:hypothetical protein
MAKVRTYTRNNLGQFATIAMGVKKRRKKKKIGVIDTRPRSALLPKISPIR